MFSYDENEMKQIYHQLILNLVYSRSCSNENVKSDKFHVEQKKKPQNSKMPAKGFKCTFCGKYYTRRYGLKIHLRTHTGYKPLKCSYCTRSFGDPSNLNKVGEFIFSLLSRIISQDQSIRKKAIRRLYKAL